MGILSGSERAAAVSTFGDPLAVAAISKRRFDLSQNARLTGV
jgi:hypothetical protein